MQSTFSVLLQVRQILASAIHDAEKQPEEVRQPSPVRSLKSPQACNFSVMHQPILGSRDLGCHASDEHVYLHDDFALQLAYQFGATYFQLALCLV